MKTDTILKNEGLQILTTHLGLVDAERFIALIAREPFDYTKWRQSFSEGLSIHEISEKAMKYRQGMR